jgi:hypothetical protein
MTRPDHRHIPIPLDAITGIAASETAGAGDGVHQLVVGGGYVHRFPRLGLTGCRTELVEVLVGRAVGLERGTPRSGG